MSGNRFRVTLFVPFDLCYFGIRNVSLLSVELRCLIVYCSVTNMRLPLIRRFGLSPFRQSFNLLEPTQTLLSGHTVMFCVSEGKRTK